MPYDKRKPFNELPLLPPAYDLESKAIFKQTIVAGRALAELKGATDLIPNPSVLVSIIGLQEAKLSSEIENIVTTNDELYRAFSERQEIIDYNPETREVLHYNEALWHGYARMQSGRPLATRMFEEIVQQIKQSSAGIRRGTGTVIADGRGEVVYTPPEGELVIRDLLANLERFIHDSEIDLDPLVKMAVMHYQFEAIHPFTDGNGRTGRILNILYLVSAGLLEVPILYLSRYIIQHKPDYYAGLRGVTEANDWEPWILFILHAVQETALDTHKTIMEIRRLIQETMDDVRERLPRIYSKELVEILFAQPYCKIRFLEDAGIVATRQTASRYLHLLADAGVLHRVVRGRDSYFVNHRFYDLLTG